jgi:hypothetical protein
MINSQYCQKVHDARGRWLKKGWTEGKGQIIKGHICFMKAFEIRLENKVFYFACSVPS